MSYLLDMMQPSIRFTLSSPSPKQPSPGFKLDYCACWNKNIFKSEKVSKCSRSQAPCSLLSKRSWSRHDSLDINSNFIHSVIKCTFWVLIKVHFDFWLIVVKDGLNELPDNLVQTTPPQTAEFLLQEFSLLNFCLICFFCQNYFIAINIFPLYFNRLVGGC